MHLRVWTLKTVAADGQAFCGFYGVNTFFPHRV